MVPKGAGQDPLGLEEGTGNKTKQNKTKQNKTKQNKKPSTPGHKKSAGENRPDHGEGCPPRTQGARACLALRRKKHNPEQGLSLPGSEVPLTTQSSLGEGQERRETHVSTPRRHTVTESLPRGWDSNPGERCLAAWGFWSPGAGRDAHHQPPPPPGFRPSTSIWQASGFTVPPRRQRRSSMT